MNEQTKDHGVPFGEAMKVWGRVAALSFGGPAGQIAVMHRIIVEEKRWIGENRFLQALNYCTLLPGPEAQQLAIYIGWLMHKTKGGLFAGTLFVLPGLIAIMALSWIYVLLGKLTIVEGLFFGLKAAVLVVVVEAVLRVGRRALRNNVMVALAAISFVAIFFYDVPFPIIVFGAGIIGYVAGRAGLQPFLAGGGHGKVGAKQVADRESLLGEETPDHAKPNLRWSLSITAIFLALWLVPVAALYLALGGDNVFTKIAIFFSEMAVVTFGGAYAVLAYVAQQAVENYHWLKPGEMLDGLGMAETTPGPLIMVTQFVGFLAAWREPGAMPPLLAATLGGLLTTWVTFTPCFLWIFFGAPFVEALRSSKALGAALGAITAAVVGVILNLAVWFGLHVLFTNIVPTHFLGASVGVPVLSSVDVPSLVLAIAAAIAIFRFKLGMIPVLLASALAGMTYYLVIGSISVSRRRAICQKMKALRSEQCCGTSPAGSQEVGDAPQIPMTRRLRPYGSALRPGMEPRRTIDAACSTGRRASGHRSRPGCGATMPLRRGAARQHMWPRPSAPSPACARRWQPRSAAWSNRWCCGGPCGARPASHRSRGAPTARRSRGAPATMKPSRRVARPSNAPSGPNAGGRNHQAAEVGWFHRRCHRVGRP
jgi:chromate transporter